MLFNDKNNNNEADTGLNRMEFIQSTLLLGGFGFFTGAADNMGKAKNIPFDEGYLSITNGGNSPKINPLEKIEVETKKEGTISVWDSMGREYSRGEITDRHIFLAGGALGYQLIMLEEEDKVIDSLAFEVEAETEIRDKDDIYADLLDMLYWSMVGEWGEAEVKPYDDEFYHMFVRWLRDHVHTLKGMKYFYPKLKSAIDLYAKSQRDDGMIWDNYYPRGVKKNWWDVRFSYGDFIRSVDNNQYEFKRIPVENDVEYLFLEGLYYTWKATGDDDWMAGHLDKALKAVEYSTSDPLPMVGKISVVKARFYD